MFKEKVDSLRAKLKAHIKPESSQEELDEINGMLTELDEVEKSHGDLVTANAKFKDTIVRMVTTQGDDNPPPADPNGGNPRSMEQFIKDFEKENKKEN